MCLSSLEVVTCRFLRKCSPVSVIYVVQVVQIAQFDLLFLTPSSKFQAVEVALTFLRCFMSCFQLSGTCSMLFQIVLRCFFLR